jgi:hypothetical protein
MIFLINNNGMRRLVRRLDYMRDNPDAIRRINFDKPIPRLKRGVLKWPVQSFALHTIAATISCLVLTLAHK